MSALLWFALAFASPCRGNINDVLLLSSGSETTHASVASAPPASGLYTGFIMDKNGVQLGEVTPVPEPASVGLLALAGTMLLRRRRRSPRPPVM